MYFCFAPVSEMPYVGLLMGGFHLQLLHSLLFFVNGSSTVVSSILINLLFMFFTALDPNRHAPFGIPFLLPFILLRDVSFSLWSSVFKTGLYIVTAYPMSPAVRIAPPVAFIVTICVWFLDGLVRQVALQDLDFPLELDDFFLHCSHSRVLGCHVIGMLCHLCFQDHFGLSEVN